MSKRFGKNVKRVIDMRKDGGGVIVILAPRWRFFKDGQHHLAFATMTEAVYASRRKRVSACDCPSCADAFTVDIIQAAAAAMPARIRPKIERDHNGRVVMQNGHQRVTLDSHHGFDVMLGLMTELFSGSWNAAFSAGMRAGMAGSASSG